MGGGLPPYNRTWEVCCNSLSETAFEVFHHNQGLITMILLFQVCRVYRFTCTYTTKGLSHNVVQRNQHAIINVLYRQNATWNQRSSKHVGFIANISQINWYCLHTTPGTGLISLIYIYIHTYCWFKQFCWYGGVAPTCYFAGWRVGGGLPP